MISSKKIENFHRRLPETPGVYILKDFSGRVLYIGKAANLKKRVRSYFKQARDYKIETLISEIKKIDYQKTDTAIEALILESRLIKKFEPPFNIKEKDDKSFLWVEITKEEFPRVLFSRGKGNYGPFTSASSIREALRIIRRIFPFSVHAASAPNDTLTRQSKQRRACFDYEIGLCPGTCVGAINRRDYLKNVKNIKLFFEGKKKKITQSLSKEMNTASKGLDFEKAEKLRRQIFALQHIQDVSLIGETEMRSPEAELARYGAGEKLPARRSPPERRSRAGLGAGGEIRNSAQRIEGYDVSNISGTSATGAMVVFVGSKPDKNEYRKFKIRTVTQSDDIGMLKEVLHRRFGNNWPLPNLILIDGGIGQVNAAKSVLGEFGLKIPVVGIAKGPTRKKNKFIGLIPKDVDKKTLIRVRNEAHRFAISYHKSLRSRKFFGN